MKKSIVSILFSIGFMFILTINNVAFAYVKVLDSWSAYTYSKYSHTYSSFDWDYFGEISIKGTDREYVGSEWQYPIYSRITFIVDEVPTRHYIYSKGENDSTVRKSYPSAKDTWTSDTRIFGFIGGGRSSISPTSYIDVE